MKKITSFWLLLICFLAFGACQQSTENSGEKDESGSSESILVTVTNPSDVDYPDARIVISKNDLIDQQGDGEKVPMLKTSDGSFVPSQTDDVDMDGSWDELAAVYPVKAGESVSLNLVWVPKSNVPTFPKRTSVHFGRRDSESSGVVPVTETYLAGATLPTYNRNQMDGPAWENDKVGYRLYFDGRNARDVFGKRTTEISLPDVGMDEAGVPIDNYHVLEDWGRDVLSVGSSMGAGGLGLKEDDQLFRLGIKAGTASDNVDTTFYKLVSSGPVRSVFDVDYKGWKVNGNDLMVHNRISIWAGQFFYENEVSVSGFEGEKNLIVGLVDSNNDQPVMNESLGDLEAIITHDKQTYEKEFYLGLALLVPNTNFIARGDAPDDGEGISNTLYIEAQIQPDEPFTYYVYSGWELQDPNFTKADFFKDMVVNSARQLNDPVSVKVSPGQ